MKSLILTAALTFAFSAGADLLNLTAGTQVKNGVNISTGAVATLDGASANLTTVGSGLRNKVVIFKIPVYVAQLMVDDTAKYVKTASGALPSLENVNAVALRMTFLRDVPAEKMSTAFQDGFDSNGIDTTSEALKTFLANVDAAGDAKQNGSLTIYLARQADGSVKLAYENLKDGKSAISEVVGGKDLIHSVLSIWLGTPSDNELGDLKAELLK